MSLQPFKPWNWFRNEEESRFPTLGGHLPLTRLHKELDRMFDDFTVGFGPISDERLQRRIMLRPELDIEEREGKYLISVELPGVDLKDVDVSVQDHLLIIRGEKRFENQEHKDKFHRIERAYGRFQRSLSLPIDAMGENIDATFKDGVLQISVPRDVKAADEPRHIEIKH